MVLSIWEDEMKRKLFCLDKGVHIFLTALLLAASLILSCPAPAGTVTYTYDELDRLIQEVYEDGTTINYTYDAVGNRLSEEVTGPGSGITLIAPNGGEHWQPGGNQTIYWTYQTGAGASVKIRLFKGGVFHSTIAASAPIGKNGSGSFDWTIPSDQAAGDNYTVRIASLTNSASSDSSRGNFTIESTAGLTLTCPVGGEKCARNSAHTIAWTYKGDPGSSVAIELMKGGLLQSTLTNSTPIGSSGSGSYSWSIPAAQTPAADYQIRVRTPGGQHTSTGGTFSVIGGFHVSSPYMGCQWQAGTSQAITWSYVGNPGPGVKIELFKGDNLHSTIAASAPVGVNGSGSYSWAIPAGQAGGSDYRLRVTSTSDSAYTNTESGGFTIRPTAITILEPNGSQQWQAGATQTISWDYAGNPGAAVKVELLKGGALHKTLAASYPVGNAGRGTYSWAIPAGQAGGTDYRVRVTSTTNGSVTDTSDGGFTIQPTMIKVMTPNGGDRWQAGAGGAIEWNYAGNPGAAVKIELLKGGAVLSTIIESVPVGKDGRGSYPWSIPSGQAGGSDYQVRITSTTNSACSDTSDNGFTILPVSLTLFCPNGGDQWQTGASYNITWSYSGNPGAAVKIELLKGGVVTKTLAASFPVGTNGVGFYSWAIPVGQAAGMDYRVRVTSTADSSCTDTSDRDFAMAPGTIRVDSPRGGERWVAGTTHEIGWSYTGNPGASVRIDLLKGDVVHSNVASGVPIGTNGRGSYLWTIAGGQTDGSDYRIRVTSTANAAVSNASTNAFTIVPIGISISSPSGWETVERGKNFTISWTYNGRVGSSVKIELLRGNVVDRQISARTSMGTGGRGSFAWSVPADQKPGSEYRIRVTSNATAGYSGTSKNSFTIVPTPITISSPNGGETCQAGVTLNINWSYTGNPGAAVRIELLKGDAVASTIASSVPVGDNGTGWHAWPVPLQQAAGADYRIRITSTEASSYTDTSNRPFTILPVLGVTSPNGNESWEAGSERSITWSFHGSPDPSVKIELLKGNAVHAVLAADYPVGTNGSGSYLWQIPFDQAGGSDYRIRVAGKTNSAYTDTSDGSFAIAPFSIALLSPNGGNQWQAASTATISWNYVANAQSLVNIELLKGDMVQSTIASGVGIGSNGLGSYAWNVPADQAGGADYRVRVTSTNSSAYSDTSDTSFSIKPSAVDLAAPNGGQQWQAGGTYTITWFYAGNPGSNVNIELLKGGKVQSTIASGVGIGVNGSGFYAWNVPAGQAGGADYRVRITSASSSVYTDTSDNNFTINPSGITVLGPYGGQWQAGTTQAISWAYVGNPGDFVKIQLLKGGVSKATIAASTPIGSNGRGSYAWDIPVGQPGGSDYRIRITSTSMNTCTDTGDYDFTINPTSISVKIPNGGDWWQADGSYTIHWTYAGNPGAAVKIELLKADAVESTIIKSVPIGANGSGSCAWNIPADQTGGADYRVRITSTSSSAYSDSSDNTFTVNPSGITVLSPNGGEWQAGMSQAMNWRYVGNPGTSVDIELLKGGETQYTIASAISIGSNGYGSYLWTIPVRQAFGNDYAIRVTGTTNPTCSDVSDSFFTIQPTLLTLTAPVGGINWKAGTPQMISWSYRGSPGSTVAIELRKGGALERVITPSAPLGTNGGGSYNWALPTDLAADDDYRVKIMSNDDNAYMDISGSDFTIVPP
jgi:YD repeat-containing protein